MSQHHSTPFSESRNHMNVLLTLTFTLRWNSTDKLPHKYTSYTSWRLYVLISTAYRPYIYHIFRRLEGFARIWWCRNRPPFRKALLLHQGLQPLAQGPSFQPTDNENGNWMRENVPNVSTVFTFNVIQQCQSTLLLRHHGSISWQNAELQSQR